MTPSNIFICYRRHDTSPYAGRLYEDLSERFVDHEVFMDLKIDLGEDFVEQVERAIGSCAVLLVLIGPDWLRVTDEDGAPRLADPRDLVRLEISMALERGVVVIPLLLRGARIPKADDLPAPLAPLVRRTGLSIRDDRWEDDVGHLVKTLALRLAAIGPPEPPPAPPPLADPLPDQSARESVDEPEDPAGVPKSCLAFLAVVLVAVLAASVAALGMLGGGDDPPPAVKVGALYSLTGADAPFGKDVVAGARLAADYINGTGGRKAKHPLMGGRGLPHLDGAKIKLVVKDFKGDRCQVQPKLAELVDRDHVAGMIGAGQSTYTLRAVTAADEQQHPVPLVNDISSAPTLTAHLARRESSKPADADCGNETGRRPSPWFFRVGPNDARAAREFFKLIDEANRSHRGRIARVAILHESNDIFGTGVAAVARGLAKRRGIEVEQFGYRTVLSTAGAHAHLSCKDPKEHKVIKQLGTQVARIKRYKPDVLFALSYEPDAVAMVQTMQRQAFNPPMLAFGSGFATSSFIPNAVIPNRGCDLPGTVPSRIIVRTGGSPDGATSALAATIGSDWARHHDNKPMNSRSAGGFMAMLTLAQAIDDAGAADPDKIQTALQYLRIPTDATIMPWGVKFNTDGDNTRARVQLQTVERTPRLVDPTSKDTADEFFGPR